MYDDITKQIKLTANIDDVKAKLAELNSQFKKVNSISVDGLTKKAKMEIDDLKKSINNLYKETDKSISLKGFKSSIAEIKSNYSSLKTILSNSIDNKLVNRFTLSTAKQKNLNSLLSNDNRTDSENEELESLIGEKAALAKTGSKVTTGLAVATTVVEVVGKVLKGINNTFNEVFGISLSLKDNFKAILANTAEMYNTMSTASASNSLLTNSKMRTQQLQYGLSDSQNYALTQTMRMLNMNSMEDVMYMNSNQKEYFNRYMERYSNMYDQLNSSGFFKNTQELKLSFEEFKVEAANSLLKFFADNKDTIMTVMNTGLDILKSIADVINFFTGNAATKSDSITQTSNRTVTVNVVNNATGVMGSTQDVSKYFSDQMSNAIKEAAINLAKN